MNKIIHDIIKLKETHNLMEEDATQDKQYLWYHFALNNGLVETYYDNTKLLGFFEYVRLDKIPKSFDDLPNCSSDFVSGKIVFVSNAISNCYKTMLKFREVLFKKNQDALCFVWHNKKNDTMKVFKNVRYGKIL